jgi:hypothetical protein
MPKQLLSNQSEWVASNFNNLADPETPLVWYTDPKTGDIYNSNQEYTDLIASGKAINNPDLQYLGLYPTKAMELYGLQTTDPKNYYNQLSKSLGDTAYNYYGRLLKEYKPVTEQIESLKTKSPQDYFNTKFELLGKQIGWNTGFGESSKNESIANELKSLIPEAKAAGFNDNQINSIITNNINTGSIDSQNKIAHDKAGSDSNFWKENLIGTAKTAAIMAAMIAGGTGAESLMAGGGAEGAAGAMGPTYGELGYTGVEGGFAGPTYGELGYTGLNQGQAIASADAASRLAQLKDYALTAKDAYSNVNRAKTIGNLLTGGASQTGQQAINPQALASALQATQAPMEQFGGLYRMNNTPFLQQQTASISPDSYNVSGQNIASPIAPTNQLLANLLYPKA